MSNPLSVFIAYAPQDASFITKLETHLKILEEDKLIHQWHSGKTLPGENLEVDIRNHLDNADIILLLISANFFASEICHNQYMKNAIRRHLQGKSKIVPILLRYCDLQGAPFYRFKALPEKWITSLDEDYALMAVSSGIRSVIEGIEKEENQRKALFKEAVNVLQGAIESACLTERRERMKREVKREEERKEKERREKKKRKKERILWLITSFLCTSVSFLCAFVLFHLKSSQVSNGNDDIPQNIGSVQADPNLRSSQDQTSTSAGNGSLPSQSQGVIQNPKLTNNVQATVGSQQIESNELIISGLSENDPSRIYTCERPNQSGIPPSPRDVESWLLDCRVYPLAVENIDFSGIVTLDFYNDRQNQSKNWGDLIHGTLDPGQVGTLKMQCELGQKITFVLSEVSYAQEVGVVLFDPSPTGSEFIDLKHDQDRGNFPGEDSEMGVFLAEGETAYGRRADSNGDREQGVYTVDIQNTGASKITLEMAIICGG